MFTVDQPSIIAIHNGSMAEWRGEKEGIGKGKREGGGERNSLFPLSFLVLVPDSIIFLCLRLPTGNQTVLSSTDLACPYRSTVAQTTEQDTEHSLVMKSNSTLSLDLVQFWYGAEKERK